MMGNQSTHSSRQKGQPTPQLSCELCRERKVKCDKLDPCTSCVSASVTCIPIRRQRLPRGRHVHHSHRRSPAGSAIHQNDQDVGDDLRRRIHRLEALVDSMSSGTPRADNAPQSSRRSLSPIRSQDINKCDQVLDPFWASLVEEVQSLRNVIDNTLSESEEDDEEITNTVGTDMAHGSIQVLGLCESGNSSLTSEPEFVSSKNPHFAPGKVEVKQLCQVYLRQVDPIIKILHRPSLERWILREASYMKYTDGHPSVEALKSAICYSAASTMSEDQCQSILRTTKSRAMIDCRRECEMAIEKSGLLSTQDITVLQSFVLYLVARRTEDRSRAMWTLIAVAVRIAKGLRLYQDRSQMSERGETFFSQQMRKRLWFTICLIDLQASLGQGSEPLISSDEMIYSFILPKHINDSDFDLTTSQPISDREELTDTTFSLVTYHIQLGGRLLGFATHGKGPSGDTRITKELSDYEERQRYAQRFQQEVLKLLHFCDPETSLYAWFTWHGTQGLVAGSQAIALRPIHRTRKGGQTQTSRTIVNKKVLSLTLEVLKQALLIHSDPRGQGFRWYIAIPLPLLAMSITECYICTDATLLCRAWPIIEASYQHYIAESGSAWYSNARMRGPLKKLIQSTREKITPLVKGGYGGSEKLSFCDDIISPQFPNISLPKPNSNPYQNLHNPIPSTSSLPSISPLTFESTRSSLTSHPTQQIWDPIPLAQYGEPETTEMVPPNAALPPSQEEIDQASRMWEEFMTSVSFDSFTGLDMSFTGDNLGSY